MTEFAFHAVKTVFLRSAIDTCQMHTESSVDSARAALNKMKKLHELSVRAGWKVDKLHSFAHW
jgi:hypothetical protein